MNSVAVNVGHTVGLSLVFTDQNGNPMIPQPTPDASPAVTWTDDNTAAATLTTQGAEAQDVAVAAGTDNVSVSADVGGVSFAATIAVIVSAAPQVLSGVEIVATVS